MKVTALALLLLLCTSAAGQSADTGHHAFTDAQKWSSIFDDPKRDAVQKPHEVIGALALEPNALVADIGAGTGYFTVRLAHAVPRGKVFAIDIEPAMLKHLAERVKAEKLSNVVVVPGAADTPNLPEKADLALMVDVYHHIADRPKYLRALKAALKAGGRFAIIDFRTEAKSGPPRAERLAPERVKAELKAAGFVLDREHRFLPEQYFLVFRAP